MENKEPVLKRVRRLDSIALDSTYFTAEGYLRDTPILTSTGIFEYTNPDGSKRRELRLPKYVFDPKSLASYKGKPIVISHALGEVTKDNLSGRQIGTILSEGQKDGDNVRAEIVITDTDALRDTGLRELSVGYSQDLLEEPGEYNGEHYDAIQTNIIVNHLALVGKARAGDKARLNIDSSDGETQVELKGEKVMARRMRNDGTISLSELKGAISKLLDQFGEEGGEESKAPAAPKAPVKPKTEQDADDDEVGTPAEGDTDSTPEDIVAGVKKNQDADDEPEDLDTATEQIARKDADIDKLIATIETLIAQVKAEKGVNGDADDEPELGTPENPIIDKETDDADDEEMTLADFMGKDTEDADDEEEEGDFTADEDGNPFNKNKAKAFNGDSVDDIVDRKVAEKMSVLRMGDKLRMDGLDKLSVLGGKKAIIKRAIPTMNLDGQSPAYINAAYGIVCGMMKDRKSTNYQRKQMYGNPRRQMRNDGTTKTMAESARDRYLARMDGTEEGGKN